MTRSFLTRRNLLVAGATAFATPYLWSRPARAAGQVVVRNPGGAYSDTQKKYIYDPFTKETGIEVVIVPSTMAKMLTMVKSGNSRDGCRRCGARRSRRTQQGGGAGADRLRELEIRRPQ